MSNASLPFPIAISEDGGTDLAVSVLKNWSCRFWTVEGAIVLGTVTGTNDDGDKITMKAWSHADLNYSIPFELPFDSIKAVMVL